MAVSICWQPVSPKKQVVRANDPARLAEAIKNAFDRSGVLGENDVPVLRGMSAAGLEGANDLIDAIKQCGQIKVSVDY